MVSFSQYESGDRIPSDATKVKIADFFGVSLDYLLGRTDTKNTPDIRASGEPATKFLEQRKLHKYSQQQLANMLFVNQTAVSQWDRGVTIPSPPTLLKLSEIYGVSTDYLLGKETKKEPTPETGEGDFMIGLKRLREERGIDQKVLAIDLNVSQPTISDWENGRKTPSVENLVRLADYFSVPLDYLLGRIELTESNLPPEPLSLINVSPSGKSINRIRDLRIAQYPKMSQEKLGQIVGVGRSTVAMWESGKSEPDNDTLIKLAEIFDVSTDYLLGRTDQKEMPAPTEEDGQSDAEKALLEMFRLVPDKDRGMVTQMIEAALRSQGLL